MTFEGFIGPAYESRSRDVATERLVNLFLEQVEVGGKKGPAALYGTPGSAVFLTLPQVPIRGAINANGRVFAVAGLKLYEIHSGGTYTERATIVTTGPVKMAYIGYQIFIASGTQGFVYNTGTNTFSSASGFPSDGCTGLAMVDNYFIVSMAGGRNVYISALNDGKIWSPSDVKVKEGWGDDVVTVFADHRELWVFGRETSEVWYNSGNADFPFERIQGAFVEAGCAAENSPAKFDNSLIWLGADARGQGMVWRANGWVPQRVSNHALEAAMQGYSRIDDATSYVYQDQGHTFYVLTFPTANKTWVLDAATNSWHEREWWDVNNGTPHAVRGRHYVFAFGKHLVGDWENGKVYQMSQALTDDFGSPIRRIRRAPAPWDEDNKTRFDRLSLILQTGAAAFPVVTLRTSNDGGYTWSNEIQNSLGDIGNYGKRVQWRRLGAARRRVFEVSITDSAPVAIVAATLDSQRGA